MLEILDILGWVCVMGGAVQLLRALILHTSLGGDDGAFRPSGVLSPRGKRLFFFGAALIVLGHALKDVIPAMIDTVQKGVS